jgi:hypothetical protein
MNPEMYRESARVLSDAKAMQDTKKAKDAMETKAFFDQQTDTAIKAIQRDLTTDEITKLKQFPPAQFKKYHLALFKAHLGCESKQIMLIDDMERNIEQAEKDGFVVVDVTGDKGLQWSHFNDLMARRDRTKQA